MSPLPGRTPPFHVEVADQLPEAIARMVAIKLDSFLQDELLQGGVDRGDGGERGRVGLVELAEADVEGVLRGGFDRVAFDAGGSEVADDRGVGLARGIVAAGDDEVEAVAVVLLSVDFDWVGGDHG